MSEYVQTGSLVLFKNNRKEEGTKQPDLTGTLTVEGVEHRISGWNRVGKSGKTFISGTTSIKIDDDASTSDTVEDSDLDSSENHQEELF